MESFSKNPKFSIVIPTYNRAHMINRAIESIINQSYDDWELIIIDDGSEDNTEAVVKSYDNYKIKYYWQENKERSIARNNGVKYAKGEWICFLDSDDEYLPDALLTYSKHLNSNYVIIRSLIKIVYENGLVLTESYKYQGQEILDFILWSTDSVLHYCFHKSIFYEFSFYPIIRWEDKDFLIRILNKHRNILFLEDTLVIAYQHSQRSVNQPVPKDSVEQILKRMTSTLEIISMPRKAVRKYKIKEFKSFVLSHLQSDGLLLTFKFIGDFGFHKGYMYFYVTLKWVQDAIR